MKRTKPVNNKERNIKLVLEYDGSGFSGWQRLEDNIKKRTIQKVLEESISHCLKEEIKIIGSGRTDKGVHAIGQVANFHCKASLEVDYMIPLFNEALPEDIKVLEATEVIDSFHSRYSAKMKTYEYRMELSEIPSVFTRKYIYYPTNISLDINAMERAAAYFVGTHDFKGFSTDRKDGKSTVRTIESLEIRQLQLRNYGRERRELRIRVTGDGFLYNMIRIIVGTLLEIGQNKLKEKEIISIFENKNRKDAGITINPEGLYLLEVKY